MIHLCRRCAQLLRLTLRIMPVPSNSEAHMLIQLLNRLPPDYSNPERFFEQRSAPAACCEL
jgi:hypothetical protein